MALKIFAFNSHPADFAVTKADVALDDCVFLLDFSRPLERLRWLGVRNKLIGFTVGLFVPVVHIGEKKGGFVVGVRPVDPYFADIERMWRAHGGSRRTLVVAEVDPLQIVGDFAIHFPGDC